MTTFPEALRERFSRPQPILVDTDAAVLFTGLSRATLYRWAAAGRITLHGSRKHGLARWDIGEIARVIDA